MSIYSEIGLSTTEATSATAAASGRNTGTYDLSQADFLSLLTTELAYQDPTDPADNKEMMGQMAQISTVNGVTTLNETVNSLAGVVTSTQALMASGLVGQSVLIDSGTGYSSGSGFAGVVNTGAAGASNVNISVLDQAGSVVYSASVPGDCSGNLDFRWDGTDSSGAQLPAGAYTVSATGLVGGVNTQLPTQVYAGVQSVLTGSGSSSTVLNLEGLGQYNFSDVLEISNN
ncbi:MAG: hypothetical protein IJV19_07590, partial [Prevotella sp.]|nr:hypothetical protein [Prevotella sp.]